MPVRINWEELAVNTDSGDRLTWDVPHEIYKSTSNMSRNSPGTPIAVLPPNESIYYDDDVSFDVEYYYRIGEIRPAGTFVSEAQLRIMAKRLILKLEALFWAQELYGTGKVGENGNLEPLEAFDGPVPDSWYWDGTGERGEWLQYWVNGERRRTVFRGDTIEHMGNIIIENDMRNYPAATIDYGAPFTNTFYYVDKERIEAPYWWPRYWLEVNVNNYPASWDEFWSKRTDDSDVADWYSKVWRK